MSKGKALIWVIIILIIVVVLAVGEWYVYVNYYKIPAKIKVNENQSDITVKKEQEFTITFVSNASTGYSWKIDGSYDKNVINLLGHEYKKPNSELIGAPGTELWTFKGVNKGNTILTFSYSRFWEISLPGMNKQPINSKTFNVTVK